MKQSMDTIQIEERWELVELMQILNTYLKEHPEDEQSETARRLLSLLDVMDMAW